MRLLRACVALTLAACSPTPPTGILVGIGADQPLVDAAPTLSARLCRDGSCQTLTHRVPDGARLPGTLSLVPRDASRGGPVTVSIQLDIPQRGAITREARLRFVSTKTKLLTIRLSEACLDVACPQGLTCDQGACVSPDIDPEALPDTSPDDDVLGSLAPPPRQPPAQGGAPQAAPSAQAGAPAQAGSPAQPAAGGAPAQSAQGGSPQAGQSAQAGAAHAGQSAQAGAGGSAGSAGAPPTFTWPDSPTPLCSDGTSTAPCSSMASPLSTQDGAVASSPTPSYVTQGSLVTDSLTGLSWEQSPPVDPVPLDQAIARCDALSLDGHDDFRLPTRLELESLLDLGHPTSRLPPSFTPFAPAPTHPAWTSTTLADGSGTALTIDLAWGGVGLTVPSDIASPLCVRGPSLPTASFEPIGTTLVRDARTHLTWTRSALPSTSWIDALATCSQLSLEGLSGFRLPSHKELATLVLDGQSPAYDTALFSLDIGHYLWTSTPHPLEPALFFWLQLDTGHMSDSPPDAPHPHLCVQGKSGNLPVSPSSRPPKSTAAAPSSASPPCADRATVELPRPRAPPATAPSAPPNTTRPPLFRWCLSRATPPARSPPTRPQCSYRFNAEPPVPMVPEPSHPAGSLPPTRPQCSYRFNAEPTVPMVPEPSHLLGSCRFERERGPTLWGERGPANR